MLQQAGSRGRPCRADCGARCPRPDLRRKLRALVWGRSSALVDEPYLLLRRVGFFKVLSHHLPFLTVCPLLLKPAQCRLITKPRVRRLPTYSSTIPPFQHPRPRVSLLSSPSFLPPSCRYIAPWQTRTTTRPRNSIAPSPESPTSVDAADSEPSTPSDLRALARKPLPRDGPLSADRLGPSTSQPWDSLTSARHPPASTTMLRPDLMQRARALQQQRMGMSARLACPPSPADCWRSRFRPSAAPPHPLEASRVDWRAGWRANAGQLQTAAGHEDDSPVRARLPKIRTSRSWHQLSERRAMKLGGLPGSGVGSNVGTPRLSDIGAGPDNSHRQPARTNSSKLGRVQGVHRCGKGLDHIRGRCHYHQDRRQLRKWSDVQHLAGRH